MEHLKKKIKGMTFIEVVVTLAIMVASIGIFTLLFLRSWQTHEFAFSVAQMQVETTQALQGMIDAIRNARQADSGAFPLALVNDRELVFYTNIDGDDEIERVRYVLSGQRIMKEVRNPTNDVPPQYPSGYETSSTLLLGVRNEVSQPLFRYYDNTNTELSGSFSVNDVAMVSVHIFFDEDEDNPPDSMEIGSFASIRNLFQYE
jgi:type II secretory pathway pseudopilin PulG